MTSNFGSEITIFDISTPESPQELASFAASSFVRDLHLIGDTLLVGTNALELIDISNPAAPQSITTVPIRDTVRAMHYREPFLHVLLENGRLIETFDLSTLRTPLSVALASGAAYSFESQLLSWSEFLIGVGFSGVRILNDCEGFADGFESGDLKAWSASHP